jgi:hypothetical protein
MLPASAIRQMLGAPRANDPRIEQAAQRLRAWTLPGTLLSDKQLVAALQCRSLDELLALPRHAIQGAIIATERRLTDEQIADAMATRGQVPQALFELAYAEMTYLTRKGNGPANEINDVLLDLPLERQMLFWRYYEIARKLSPAETTRQLDLVEIVVRHNAAVMSPAERADEEAWLRQQHEVSQQVQLARQVGAKQGRWMERDALFRQQREEARENGSRGGRPSEYPDQHLMDIVRDVGGPDFAHGDVDKAYHRFRDACMAEGIGRRNSKGELVGPPSVSAFNRARKRLREANRS